MLESDRGGRRRELCKVYNPGISLGVGLLEGRKEEEVFLGTLRLVVRLRFSLFNHSEIEDTSEDSKTGGLMNWLLKRYIFNLSRIEETRPKSVTPWGI